MKWIETVDLGRTEIGVIGDPKVISGATPKSSVDLGFVTKFRQNLPAQVSSKSPRCRSLD